MDQLLRRQNNESTQVEQQKEEIIKRNEGRVKSSGTTSNILISTLQESEKEKRGRVENLSEEIIAENIPNLGKETVYQVQIAERAPNKMNPKRSTPRHIIIKMSKIKERILKVEEKSNELLYKGNSKRLSVDFSAETTG